MRTQKQNRKHDVESPQLPTSPLLRMARGLFFVGVFTILGTSVLILTQAATAPVTITCPSGKKPLAGTVTGVDRRVLNVLIGIDAIDAKGKKLRLDGGDGTGLSYTHIIKLNQHLDAVGRARQASDTATFGVCLPHNTVAGNIEVYPKKHGVTTQTRYANARKPFDGKGPWPGTDITLPLVCGASASRGTGRIAGSVTAAGLPVIGTRGPAWARGANPEGVWGFAAGSTFTKGAYKTQELAPGSLYDLRLSYNNMTQRNTDVRVNVCKTTVYNASFIGDDLPLQTSFRMGQEHVRFSRTANSDILWSNESGNTWSAWKKLNAASTHNPTATLSTAKRPSVLITNKSAVLFNTMQQPNAWSAWTQLPELARNVTPVSRPTAITNSKGQLQVFVRGSNSQLYTIRQINAQRWGVWRSLGGSIATEPTVVMNASKTLEIFAVRTPNITRNNTSFGQGQLVHIWQNAPDGTWSSWQPLGGTTLATVTPTAVVNTNGTLEVFSRRRDGAPMHIKREAQWGNWRSLGGKIVSGIVAVQSPNGRIELYVRGTNNLLHRTSTIATNSDRFNAWESILPGMSTRLNSLPEVALKSNGLPSVAMKDTQNNMCEIALQTNATWSPWTCRPPNIE